MDHSNLPKDFGFVLINTYYFVDNPLGIYEINVYKNNLSFILN